VSAALVSVVGGLVGGLLGAGVMSAGHALVTAIVRPPATPPAAREDDATVKVANRGSLIVRGRALDEREKPAAGTLVHYGFGAAMGGIYGIVSAASPAVVGAGAGAGFGLAVWFGAHAIVVPALGLAPSPLREPAAKEVRELILHIAYGLTVGLAHGAAVRIATRA
jgi:putative membrane protein